MASISSSSASPDAAGLLVNTRTINRTGQLIRKSVGEDRGNGRITVDELAEIISLLEAVAASTQVHYDGSVPAMELERLRDAEALIETGVGGRELFDPVMIEPRDLTALCRRGVIQSRALIAERVARVEAEGTAALARMEDIVLFRGDARAMAAFVGAVAAPQPPAYEAMMVAQDIALRDFNGAKFVAGLISAAALDPDCAALAGRVRALVARFQGDEGALRRLLPMFMNGFRVSFLNLLAEERADAAFFSGVDTARTLERQTPHLLSQIAARAGEPAWEALGLDAHFEKRMRAQHAFPFLGLLLFLGAEPGEPYSMFAHALNDRDDIRNAFLLRRQRHVRRPHDMTEQDLRDFATERIDGIAGMMETRHLIYERMMRITTRFIHPVIENLSMLKLGYDGLLAIAGALGVTLPEETNATYGVEEFDGLSQHLDATLNVAVAPGPHLHVVAYTERIHARLREFTAEREGGALLQRKAQEVLGLELVP